MTENVERPNSEPLQPNSVDTTSQDETTKYAEEMRLLKEECQDTINHLNDENIASLTGGERRIGYRIGELQSNSFVLAQPVVQDIDGNRYHNYVVITAEGIRAVRFNKGRVDTDGNIRLEYPGGLSLDSVYQNSELAFQIALESHAASWDNPKTGERKATAVFGEGSSLQYTFSGEEGKWYPHAENGGIHVSGDGSERFQIRGQVWDDQHTGVAGLIAEVSEDMVNQAVDASLEAAKTAREVPTTSTEEQRATLKKIKSRLPKTE